MSISTVTSEALQLKLRQLLPSQQGFGTDLSASDTIIPVIDLTRAAEGSDTPEILQTALSFGSKTAFAINNATVVIANTTGFHRIFGVANLYMDGTAFSTCTFQLSDGTSTKNIWGNSTASSAASAIACTQFYFVVFLGAGESISGIAGTNVSNMIGSVRQIADINGTLVQPVGFTPQ